MRCVNARHVEGSKPRTGPSSLFLVSRTATSARIAALNQAEDGAQRPDADAYGWITALRAPGHPQADGGRRAAAAVPV
jgi:hypothetical protein